MGEAEHLRDRRGVARLEAFSDGVFAIAITLLVLGSGVPTVSGDPPGRGRPTGWPGCSGGASIS